MVGVGEPRRLAVKTTATMVEASTAPVAANAGGDNPDVFLSKVLQKILSEKEVSERAHSHHTHSLSFGSKTPLRYSHIPSVISPVCLISCVQLLVLDPAVSASMRTVVDGVVAC